MACGQPSATAERLLSGQEITWALDGTLTLVVRLVAHFEEPLQVETRRECPADHARRWQAVTGSRESRLHATTGQAGRRRRCRRVRDDPKRDRRRTLRLPRAFATDRARRRRCLGLQTC